MSTISEKLTQLNTIKGDIKAAINNKGGEVGNDFSTYATAINNLSTGSGGSGETYENPEFYELRTSNGTNYDNLFRGYNGPDIDVSQWDTSKVTSARYCFSECNKSMDINNWDLSNLKNAYNMFNHFTNNNKYIDLSVLDFSNVIQVSYMFSYANIDYLDVRNINLTGTTSCQYLFYNCSGNKLDLSSWDISNATDLTSMCNTSKFKKIDLTGWNTVNVKNMGSTFSYMSNLETLIIPDWDMTNATSTYNFIYNVPKLKYIDLSRSNDFTIKKIASFLPTKTATTYGEVVIPANASQDAIDALTAKYWKPIGPKIDLNSTEIVLELDEIKPGKTTKIYTGNSDPWYGDDRLEIIEFISSDESIATVNGREITGVLEGTVTIECRRREDNAIISTAPATLNVSETDSKPNLIKFRTDGNESSSTDLLIANNVYITPSKITKDDAGIYNYDPGEQITRIKFNCYGQGFINEIIKFNFNEANITRMNGMFSYYKGTTLDLSDWDTSKVVEMYEFVANAPNITDIIGYLDLSELQGLTQTRSAFLECPKLETLYLKNIYKNCTMTNNLKWSINLETTKVKDECLLYIINELPDLYAKGLTETDQITFTLPPTNTLTQEQIAVGIAKGWTFINVNN